MQQTNSANTANTEQQKATKVCATPEATKAYADRMWAENPKLAPDGWRMVEDLTIGKVAMGTYRMDGRDKQPQALEKALLSGMNLIDTSANYMDGGAEVFVGQALQRLFKAGKLKREEVVITTKAGYIQGQTLAQYKDNPPTEAMFLNDQLWHCIHPEFLDQQINQSLERLQVEAIDIFMLHNPEYYFAKVQEGTDEGTLAELREEFYTRVQYAFTYLESLCQQGTIQCYGVSANTLVEDPAHPQFVDLARLHEAAQNAAKEAWGRRKRPMFRVVQLPYNLIEVGALARENTEAKTYDGSEPSTTLDLAARMHLSVIANRPLNAFTPSGRAFRLAEGAGAEPVMEAICNKLADFEMGLPQSNLPRLSVMAPQLAEKMQGSMHFDHVKMTVLTPLLLETLHMAKFTEAEAGAFIEAYQDVVQALRTHARNVDAQHTEQLNAHLQKKLPKGKSYPLQQVALNVIPSTPGVTAVLCGMRDPAYVDDGLAVLEMGDFADVGSILLEQQAV